MENAKWWAWFFSFDGNQRKGKRIKDKWRSIGLSEMRDG